jgi:hypothetical protein
MTKKVYKPINMVFWVHDIENVQLTFRKVYKKRIEIGLMLASSLVLGGPLSSIPNIFQRTHVLVWFLFLFKYIYIYIYGTWF